MIKTIPVFLYIIFNVFSVSGQTPMPITEYPVPNGSIVIYFSGDGGMNTLSKSLCHSLQLKGCSVLALDSREYFWKRKTPAEAAADLTDVLRKKIDNGKKEVMFVGYSFGADVMPFIMDKLSETLRAMVKGIILISPSGSTDMEVHLADMMGGETRRSMDVVQAIKQLTWVPVHCILEKEDKKIDLSSNHASNISYQYLPGGHHFNGDTKTLADIITSYF